MTEAKDNWYKCEIVANIVAKFFIPAVVAASIFWWNSERTEADSAAKMTEIAISILSQEPSNDFFQDSDPIRTWAVKVLQNPSSPPPLSDEAAAQLSRDPSLLMKAGISEGFQQTILRYALDDQESSFRNQPNLDNNEELKPE